MRSLILVGTAALMLAAGCTNTQGVGTSSTKGVEWSDPANMAVAHDMRDARAASGKDFVARVVGDTEDVWDALFTSMESGSYPRPLVVLYVGNIASACGRLSREIHPFYCSADKKVYLDTAFLSDLSQRTGRAGDFAQAYLIAHEIGHHVQNVLDSVRKVEPMATGRTETQPVQLRRQTELQADCFAGVWAHYVQKRGLLDPGDLEDGVPAALAVGDPFIQGDVAQRMNWFMRGLGTGDPRSC